MLAGSDEELLKDKISGDLRLILTNNFDTVDELEVTIVVEDDGVSMDIQIHAKVTDGGLSTTLQRALLSVEDTHFQLVHNK